MKKRILKVTLLVLLLALGFAVKANTNSAVDDRPVHEIHAMMIYNFIKYVEWPDDARSGKFVIGVFGDKDLLNNLQQFYTNRLIKGQKVEIVYFNKVSDVKPTQVMYLADNQSGKFDEIKNIVSGKPTLLITDGASLGKDGSCINFRNDSGKLKFEINEASVSANKLKVSSQLLSMGIKI
ncbi:MAG: hypothetical protein ACJAT1_001447 [Marivirga sp.]|jgi:hypothetical protein